MGRSTHHKHTWTPSRRWRITTRFNKSFFTAFSTVETRRHLQRQLASKRYKERWRTLGAARSRQLSAVITPWTETSDGNELAGHTSCSCLALANITRILLLPWNILTSWGLLMNSLNR